MRIVSKFQDYYDSVQAYGHDERLTFVRHRQEYHFEYGRKDGKAPHGYPKGLSKHYAPNPPGFNSKHWHTNPNGHHLIGFCGKVYLIYQIDGGFYTSVPDFFRAVENGTSADNFSENEWERKERLKEHLRFIEKARESDRKKVSGQKKKYIPWSARDTEMHFFFTEKEWERWLEYSEGKMVMPDEAFLNYESPILQYSYVGQTGKLIVNPCLKELGFPSLVDSWTAFQEIDMYLGNNMADQFDPTANRTDDEIRDSKGMDEWSFRNPSPGNKRRKQRKSKD